MRQFSDAPYSLVRRSAEPVLYVVRHGSTGTGDDAFNSPENPHLDDKGRKEAEEAAKFLQGRKIGRIFTSEFFRAKETGDILGKLLEITPKEDADINSLDVGDVKNMKSQEEADRIIKHHQNNPGKVIPGGESITQFQNRTRPRFTESLNNFYKTGKADVLSAHHSLEQEAGEFFNKDKDSATTKPGGVVGIFQTPNGFEARPIFKPE